jgi:hypothetical protein
VKSLPNKFFGPSGIPCVFAIDDAGGTAIGYFLKQLSDIKFIATDGAVTKIVHLAQTLSDVADLTNMASGLCTVLVAALGGPTEHVKRITEYRCASLEGSLHSWHNADPSMDRSGIVMPSLHETFFRLLENDSKWLLETNNNWLIETAPIVPLLLVLENGSLLLLEYLTGEFELEGQP